MHANRICYETSMQIENLLSKPTSNNFKLVFISGSDGGKDQSYITTAFEKKIVSTPTLPSDKLLRPYLKNHLTVTNKNNISAAQELDPENCSLRVVTSKDYGNGKLYTI